MGLETKEGWGIQGRGHVLLDFIPVTMGSPGDIAQGSFLPPSAFYFYKWQRWVKQRPVGIFASSF